MIINEKNIKMWSVIGQRATLGLTLYEIAKKNKNLMVLTSDVSTSAGLDRFRKNFTDQYVDVGIAEQNLIGVAAGMSSEGFDVITTTFSPFQILRCCEQIKVNISYMNIKVIMVGLASGVSLGTLGYTHCSIEDVSVARSIPNLDVICPSDGLETIKSVEHALASNNSTYIRLTGTSNNPIINEKDYKFEIGKSVIVKDYKTPDVIIFASGSMVSHSIDASNILANKKIKCKVINIHTLTKLDEELLIDIGKMGKLIITVEEHSIIGGLFSLISEFYSKKNFNVKILPIGHPHNYGKGGEYKYLLNKYGLDKQGISSKIMKELKI